MIRMAVNSSLICGFCFLTAASPRPAVTQQPAGPITQRETRQANNTGERLARPPDGGVRQVLVSTLIPSLPNAPFTATLETTTSQQLPNGAEIRMKNRRMIARDSDGRIFQERRLLVPDDGKHESVLTQIEISDPLKHQLFICVPPEQVCQLEQFAPPEGPDPRKSVPQLSGPGMEKLGQQTIQGVETVGVRQLTVIETGSIGNDRPLAARREFWYSPQLGINMSSLRDDPRSGLQKFAVAEITLGEPDSRLFSPSPGYKIVDLRETNELPAKD